MKILLVTIILLINLLNSEINAQPNKFDFSKVVLLQKELLQLKFTNSVTGESNNYSKTLIDTVEANKPIYLIKTIEIKKKSILKINKNDLQPIFYSSEDSSGRINKKIRYSNKKAYIYDAKNKLERKIDIDENTYNSSMLIYLFRMLAFDIYNRKVFFNLIIDARGWGLRKVEMYVKVVAEEEVYVPAGKFSCYKVELGTAGIIGKLFWSNKYYYYFTKEAPHYFVKYFDPEGERIELIKYQIFNK